MAQFYSLFSSSKGNAAVLISEGRGILIDCGVSYRLLTERMKECSLSWQQLDGILLTHEHIDHIRAIPQILKHEHPTIYACATTLANAEAEGIDHNGKPFQVGNFHVTPIRTSHDVCASFGYRIDIEGKSVGFVTDTGKITPEMNQYLTGCSLIVLESNYDPQMLALGPYPAQLQARIRSDRGHLSNNDCAALLALKALEGSLKTAVLAHLSDHNNTPMTAKMAVLEAFEQYGIEDIQLEVGGPFCPCIEL